MLPKDETDISRWRITQRKRRILENCWESDVSERIGRFIDTTRQQNSGSPMTCLNLYSNLVNQFASVYDSPPTITTSDPELDSMLQSTGVYGILSQNCFYTVGLREDFIKIEVSESGEVRLRLVTPDTIVIETADNDPWTIETISELRMRKYGEEVKPYWDVWSIEDGVGSFKIVNDEDEDVTVLFIDSSEAADPSEPYKYPYVKADGTPFLPWVMYRAKWTSHVWNAHDNEDIVNGTLDTAVLYSVWNSLVVDASYPQRWGLGVTVPGMQISGSGAARVGEVPTSPTSILLFDNASDAPGSLGQFQPGGDPKAMGEAIQSFTKTLLANVGIAPADIQSTGTESGYAISLKRSSQRREVQKLIPSFRASDTELFKKMSWVSNIFSGTTIPEDVDIQISYNIPSPDAVEEQAVLDREIKYLELGLISKIDIMKRLHPEMNEQELAIMLQENRLLNQS